METRARYVVIGTFVLLVIFAAFGFVYWLQNVGGLGERAIYRIRFEQPVSGLVTGSGVLFNGIRVGAITGLNLDPADPQRLIATISVDPDTPIHADTQIEITFQGLTGSPAILLSGGSTEAPLLKPRDGEVPLLVAGKDVGMNLSDSARLTLRHLDNILTDNAKPLHNAVEGISTFADMLGRNTKKIEGMLDGLDKMLGGSGGKPAPKVYDLEAATAFPGLDTTIKQQVSVPDPRAILAFDTQNILIRSAGGTYSNVEDARWADNLPKLLQAKIVESFENASQVGAVSRPLDQMEAAYQLELNIRSFQIALQPKPVAAIEFTARILAGKGKVLDARIFKASAPAKDTEAADAVAALNEAFKKTAAELVAWTVEKISAAPPPQASGNQPEDMNNSLDKDMPPMPETPPAPGGEPAKPPGGAKPPAAAPPK